MVPRFSTVWLLGLFVGQRFTRAQNALITKSHYGLNFLVDHHIRQTPNSSVYHG